MRAQHSYRIDGYECRVLHAAGPERDRAEADVLRAGGADLAAEVRYRMGQVVVWTPWDLLEVVQLIVGLSSKIERLRAQGWKFEDELSVQLMHMPH